VVNSKFTASVFKKAFPRIQRTPDVLYPPINLEAYDKKWNLPSDNPFNEYLKNPQKIILSINRFERKKNIPLAVHAFAELKNLVSEKDFENLQLVIAGGYDTRVTENVEHLNELIEISKSYKLSYKILWSESKDKPSEKEKSDIPLRQAQVVFLPSFSEAERSFLLTNSLCLIYTPSNEHFGIVPCEAMYAMLPVIAVNNGGPTESIVHEETGLLLESDPKLFATGLKKFVQKDFDTKKMGQKGRERVKDNFSLTAFTSKLEDQLNNLVNKKKK